MAQHYSDPHALPDLETFFMTVPDLEEAGMEAGTAGWYYWFCFPGCLPEGDPIGPFATEAEALADARDGLIDDDDD